jgi:hypothetical protein
MARIQRALRPEGGLFVANGVMRSVPTTDRGWFNDGLDIKRMLASEFRAVHEGQLAREKTSEALATHTFWGLYRPR